jgi:PhzF family phenazine biosynthesis protein
MKLPIYQIDAFANRLFTGNPAAVVLLESNLTTETMQAIAAENNLAETAFVEKKGDIYHIRWFTPTIEVDLCGHATLASAHVIFKYLKESAERISFSSRSGTLHVRRESEFLYLDFPSDPPQAVEQVQDLIEGLGTQPIEIYKGREDFLAIYDSDEIITTMKPDMEKLSRVQARGVIVSAPGGGVDFVSRFFAPQSGIPEDPVTGSAHTVLIPYWSKKLDKQSMHARQLSKRGGELICKNLGERVEIGGQAMTYLIGEIML